MAETRIRPEEKIAPWNDPRFRAIFFQVLVLGGTVALVAYLINNTLDNLARQGIASGFGFLNTTSGIKPLMGLIEYSEESSYGRMFFVGLLNTILVSVLGIIAATIIGFIVGIARLSTNWIVAQMAYVFVEVVRNVPLLLQIFFWYFGVFRGLPGPRESIEFFEGMVLNNRGLYMPSPILEQGFMWIPISFGIAVVAVFFMARWAKRRQEATGQPFHTVYASLGLLVGLPLLVALALGMPISWDYPALKGFNFTGGMVLIPELVALWLALSIYTAAYIAEVVRSGIEAVSHGQTEAAHSLGLRNAPTLRLVVIPQAFRVIIPPLTNQYLNLTKNSSLAAAIAYPDLVLVFAGIVLNQTGQAVEIMAITMGIYLFLSLVISAFMNWFNKRMALVER